MSPSLLEKARSLKTVSADVLVLDAAKQHASQLKQRLTSLQSTLADIGRAEKLYATCRLLDNSSSLARVDTAALAAQVLAFRQSYERQGDVDQAALALAGALNAVRDQLRAAVAAWWHQYAIPRVREAGADAIDLLEPDEQDEARSLVARLQKAADGVPRVPMDVASFENDLVSLTELISYNEVADLPEELRAVLRAVGSRSMRLSDLTCELLALLKERGYAERLSINWGG